MPESRKTGKSAADIFAATDRATPAASRQGPGHPPVHEEDWTKVTVVLLNLQIVFLDRLASDIREKTGAAIKRAEIIRALIDALVESGMDLTAAGSEAELKALLSRHLGA
jgi:hypothetical protein